MGRIGDPCGLLFNELSPFVGSHVERSHKITHATGGERGSPLDLLFMLFTSLLRHFEGRAEWIFLSLLMFGWIFFMLGNMHKVQLRIHLPTRWQSSLTFSIRLIIVIANAENRQLIKRYLFFLLLCRIKMIQISIIKTKFN